MSYAQEQKNNKFFLSRINTVTVSVHVTKTSNKGLVINCRHQRKQAEFAYFQRFGIFFGKSQGSSVQ